HPTADGFNSSSDYHNEPLLIEEPAGGIPPIVDTEAQLQHVAEKLRSGSGPIAVDTERASGYRYGQRAFLIQLTREGGTIWQLDYEALLNVEPIQKAFTGVEWILQAAIHDHHSLRQAGHWLDIIFETVIARLLHSNKE